MLFTIPNNGDNKEEMRKRITKNEQRKTLMQICMNHSCPRVGAYCIRPTNVFSRKRIPCICIIHFWMCARFMRFYAIRSRLGKTFMRFHMMKNTQQKTFTPIRMSFIFGKTNPMKNAGHIHRRTYAAPGITTDDLSLITTVYSSGKVISGPLP